jgi:hypothetical protein
MQCPLRSPSRRLATGCRYEVTLSSRIERRTRCLAMRWPAVESDLQPVLAEGTTSPIDCRNIDAEDTGNLHVHALAATFGGVRRK